MSTIFSGRSVEAADHPIKQFLQVELQTLRSIGHVSNGFWIALHARPGCRAYLESGRGEHRDRVRWSGLKNTGGRMIPVAERKGEHEKHDQSTVLHRMFDTSRQDWTEMNPWDWFRLALSRRYGGHNPVRVAIRRTPLIAGRRQTCKMTPKPPQEDLLGLASLTVCSACRLSDSVQTTEVHPDGSPSYCRSGNVDRSLSYNVSLQLANTGRTTV